MRFEELDDITRRFMLEEFEAEEAGGNPYRGKDLSEAGRAAFPDLMRRAIFEGNEEALAADLTLPAFWNPTETYERADVVESGAST